MFGMLQIVSLAALLTVTTAQCINRLTNSSFTLIWSANNTYVSFTMSAPSNGNQYIAVGFANSSNSDIRRIRLDLIYGGENGQGQSFVLDGWLVESTDLTVDTQQNLTQTSTSLSNGILTVSFTRPIVSHDKSHDLDLDVCRNIWWGYDGSVTSISPLEISTPAKIGYFSDQICLPNNCQGSGSAGLIASLTTIIIVALMFALI